MCSLVGKTLGARYQIRQKIGEGGFEDTYQAIDLDLPNQPVCVVKHLKPKDAHPGILELAKEKFNREAQTLYRLGNANEQIPRLFAHFEEEGQFYLVHEFVDGHDLSQELNSGYPKIEKEVLQLLKETLEILAFVHQQNVIHQDIKPQNIRRRRDGKIVLIGFGAVKEVATLGVNSQGQMSQTVAIGTPGYMPSEQQSGRPDFSSDIYALGIIAFQALTGFRNPETLPQDPHTGELCCALFRQCDHISPAVVEILDTMVRYDYRQRYKDATVALEALEDLLELEEEPTLIPKLTQDQNSNRGIINQPSGTSSQEEKTSIFQGIVRFFQDLLSGSEPETSIPPTIIPSSNVEQPEKDK